MAHEISAVLEYGVPQPGETTTMMEDKLRLHTDSWDLSVDLKAGVSEIIVIDARSRDATPQATSLALPAFHTVR